MSNLLQRSVRSVAWTGIANSAKLVVLYVRSVLLARLLPVEAFGTVRYAESIVVVSSVLVNFGLDAALLNRASETEDEGRAASIHLTLRLMLFVVWSAAALIFTLTATGGDTRLAFLIYIACNAIGLVTHTERLILVRRVAHRRIAVFSVADAAVSTVVALVLAWRGAYIWALLSLPLTTAILAFFTYVVWRPVWRPRLRWDRDGIRYYLRFGRASFPSMLLSRGLDRVDDIWTNIFLGEQALGFYSRAYAFANYPRSILAAPLNEVSGGTYAELKHDRRRLSQAFVRTNALLIRSSFLLGGLLVLIAPEFIRLQLTAKWMPMLDAFRLMAVYTLFSPLKNMLAMLFSVTGHPEQVLRARLVQMGVLVVGLFTLGRTYGITGVAAAATLMLLVGIAQFFWQARRLVDFSLRRLFLAPSVALTLALIAGRLAILLPGVAGSDWRTGAVKSAFFLPVFALVMLALERETMRQMAAIIRRALR